MKNGEQVAAFEREFASYVGARFAVALCNGTATLHTALVALGVKPGDRVAVPPLTMSATTMAVLQAGAVPAFLDVDPLTWLASPGCTMPVSLYGLRWPEYPCSVDDAAQTLRPFNRGSLFTSYSFQSSKIFALGEGGMLVTNDEALAVRAREFSSLGYRMRADQPRIDPATLKSPTFDRHHTLGWNYRMNDLTARKALRMLPYAGQFLQARRLCAQMYQEAVQGCDWLTPQYVPEGWTHDYWCYAVAYDVDRLPRRASILVHPHRSLTDAIVKHGGERPYAAWKLTYQEPAFHYLAPDGICPVAESLQPRLLQFQTNDLSSAEKNAAALKRAIQELS